MLRRPIATLLAAVLLLFPLSACSQSSFVTTENLTRLLGDFEAELETSIAEVDSAKERFEAALSQSQADLQAQLEAANDQIEAITQNLQLSLERATPVSLQQVERQVDEAVDAFTATTQSFQRSQRGLQGQVETATEQIEVQTENLNGALKQAQAAALQRLQQSLDVAVADIEATSAVISQSQRRLRQQIDAVALQAQQTAAALESSAALQRLQQSIEATIADIEATGNAVKQSRQRLQQQFEAAAAQVEKSTESLDRPQGTPPRDDDRDCGRNQRRRGGSDKGAPALESQT